MKTPLTDPEILELLLKEIHHTANSLGVVLNYSSSSSIYHILNGVNKISEGFATRVVSKFPNVNYLFLRNGELPILNDEAAAQGQKNVLNSGPTFNDIPDLLKSIEQLLSSINKKLPGENPEEE